MPMISSFGGIFPRIPDHLLPENAATIAHDVKLRNGILEAWREKQPISVVDSRTKTMYQKGCCLLSFSECATVSDYVVDYGRLFITGRADRPENIVLGENCTPMYTYLGVPAPLTPPQVVVIEQYGRDCSARSYMYTYVNQFGEESAPGPATTALTIKDGSPVTVWNIAPPPDGYGITTISIYRTGTAYREGSEKEQQMYTDFFWVADISSTANSYVDMVLEMNNGDVCNTRENRPPPRNLRQIRHVKGTGTLTGVTNNKIHFSADFQPANWPADNDLTLRYNIVNMVVVGGQAIVSTDGYPYVVDARPNCEPRKCRPTGELDIPLPDIGCGYPNSAIATPFGMVYSSKDGLVLVSPDARFQIITEAWFSTEKWIEIRPDTVRLAYWRGYLICVTDMVSFMIEIDSGTYGDFKLGAMFTISDKPIDMITTSNGELLMLENTFISQWNAGKSKRSYIWESRELLRNGRYSPTTAKVRTDGITFKLIEDRTGTEYVTYVHDETPFRLRRLGRRVNYRIGFQGTGTVGYAALGMANESINQGR